MSTLILATEGCCKGHPCDNCKTCQSGRCCRRDNPDYKLPGLGEWDGPIYGELGVLNDDGDKIECHCCGGWFNNVGIHAAKAHDLRADEYKSTFGLRATIGLVGPTALRYLRSQRIIDRLSRVRPSQPWVTQATPEQRSAMAHRPWRLQSRISLASRSENTSPFVGVSWHKQMQKWGARLTMNGVSFSMGLHETPEAAARAYDAKARELYGDKARLNFPGEAP